MSIQKILKQKNIWVGIIALLVMITSVFAVTIMQQDTSHAKRCPAGKKYVYMDHFAGRMCATLKQRLADKIYKQYNENRPKKSQIDLSGTPIAGVVYPTNPEGDLFSVLYGNSSYTQGDCSDWPNPEAVYGARPGAGKKKSSSTQINSNILRFMLALSKKTSYKVHSIVGGCHSDKFSPHFYGRAVDIDCSLKGKLNMAKRIGKKYGIFLRAESDCVAKKGGHYHFSTGVDKSASRHCSNGKKLVRINKKKKKCLDLRQRLALRILKQSKRKKIRFYVLNEVDRAAKTTARSNIISAYKGEKSKLTTECAGRGGEPNIDGKTSVHIDIRLLKFLYGLSKKTSYGVNAITGQCHSSTSAHYDGVAVDIACPFDYTKVGKADKVGGKFGISHNTESCSDAAPHYHYSVGGR